MIKVIFSVLTMIRAGNLLIASFTLILIRHFLILPILEIYGTPSGLTGFQYNLLTLSIILTAAGGYVINNIFDQDIDAINKPERKIFQGIINASSATSLYILICIGAIAAAYFSVKNSGTLVAVYVVLVSCGLLYFYAAGYKKMLIAGNIVVAALIALMIYLPAVADTEAGNNDVLKSMLAGYAVFAFLLTLVREIIKDCEDVEGDKAFNAQTIPIILGKSKARLIAAIILIITLIMITYIQVAQQQWQDLTSFTYTLFAIQVPAIILSTRLIFFRHRDDDRKNSMLAKIIMLTGVASILVFYLSSS